MTNIEKLHDAVKFTIKVIFILILSVILFFVLAVSAFLIADAISFRSSQSEGYKIAHKLANSNKLKGMDYDNVIELLNEYHEECEDFGGNIRGGDNRFSGESYTVKCDGGSAYGDWGPVTEYVFQITFDGNDNVTDVNHYFFR